MVELIDLRNIPYVLPVLAKWAEDKWGYIRNMGVKYREKVFEEFLEGSAAQMPLCCVAVVNSFFGKGIKHPIGMFVLQENDLPNGQRMIEMMYVYLDAPYRSQGVGAMLIRKAIGLAASMNKSAIVFDTLSPSLDRFYKKFGAKRVGGDWDHGRLFGEPATKYYMNIQNLPVEAKMPAFVSVEQAEVKGVFKGVSRNQLGRSISLSQRR